MIIATSQYPFENLKNQNEYFQKITAHIEWVTQKGAKVVLFPEYAGMEWIWLFSGSFKNQCYQAQTFLNDYLNFFSQLAIKYQCYIVSGSLFFQINEDFFNRSFIFSPSGAVGFQDKIHLTPSEKQLSFLKGGNEISVFQTKFGTMGIAICYDVEFPHYISHLIQSNCQLILVPSYTETKEGFYRVHIASRARAMENQCYVAHSCALGHVKCNYFDGLAQGQAGLFTPIDSDFPFDGIQAFATNEQKTWLNSEVNFTKIETVRKYGQVRNYQDQKGSFQQSYTVKYYEDF